MAKAEYKAKGNADKMKTITFTVIPKNPFPSFEMWCAEWIVNHTYYRFPRPVEGQLAGVPIDQPITLTDVPDTGILMLIAWGQGYTPYQEFPAFPYPYSPTAMVDQGIYEYDFQTQTLSLVPLDIGVGFLLEAEARYVAGTVTIDEVSYQVQAGSYLIQPVTPGQHSFVLTPQAGYRVRQVNIYDWATQELLETKGETSFTLDIAQPVFIEVIVKAVPPEEAERPIWPWIVGGVAAISVLALIARGRK